jgi:hypothetical protein
LFDFRFRFVCVSVLFQIGNDDIRTFLCEGDSYGAADAAVSAGDDRHFRFQLITALIFSNAGVGAWVHLGFAAGLLWLVLLGNVLFLSHCYLAVMYEFWRILKDVFGFWIKSR